MKTSPVKNNGSSSSAKNRKIFTKWQTIPVGSHSSHQLIIRPLFAFFRDFDQPLFSQLDQLKKLAEVNEISFYSSDFCTFTLLTFDEMLDFFSLEELM